MSDESKPCTHGPYWGSCLECELARLRSALAAALKAKEEQREALIAERNAVADECWRHHRRAETAVRERDEARAALRIQNDLALERLAEVERLRGALTDAMPLARSAVDFASRYSTMTVEAACRDQADAIERAIASSTQTKGEQP